jgi:photosystem II stability/assembly factor-like uncharacterized protein
MKLRFFSIAFIVFIILYFSAPLRAQWQSTGHCPGTPVYGPESLFAHGETLFNSTDSGVFRSTDDGMNWVRNSVSDSDAISSFTSIGSIIFAGGRGVQVFRSVDDGKTWFGVGGPNNITSLATFNSTVFASSSYLSLNASTDSGSTWTLDSPGGGNPNRISLVRVVGDNVLISGAGGYRHKSFGGPWSDVTSESSAQHFIDFGGFGSTVVGANLASILPSASVLLRSTDGGSNWSDINNAMLDSAFIDAFAMNNSPLFAGGESKVFVSEDTGRTWTDESQGLPIDTVSALAVSDKFLFSSTLHHGVWRRPLSDFEISSVAQTPVPTQPEIHSFPNPFTQSTEITFTTQAAGYAEVSIVNTLGVEVARLFAGELGAGNHSFTWDAEKISAPRGVYWCVVKRDERVDTLPVALVR